MSTGAAELNLHESVARSKVADFNGLARIYRWMEWCSFGPFLWNCRCAFLHRLRRHQRALVIGDGDGRFAARLLQENASVAVDAVDASSAMLAELEDRAGTNRARLRTHVADARSFLPPRRNYDLVVTHFFLDCLTTEEATRLASRLRKHVTENATWIVSEFAIPPGWYGRAIARPLITGLYWAFGWLTGLEIRRLPSYRSGLLRAGWRLQQERKWLGGLLVSELWHPAQKL